MIVTTRFARSKRSPSPRGLAARLVVWCDRAPLALARWALSAGLRGVCVEHFLLDAPIVAALRGEGLSVTTGTVNHAAIAERVLARAPEGVSEEPCKEAPG